MNLGQIDLEPHHDGTPHWHLLLFVEPENKTKLLDIMKRYCFEEDADEKGAVDHRFEVVKINPNKGSATGYIAKYISKNIDGKDLMKALMVKTLSLLPSVLKHGPQYGP